MTGDPDEITLENYQALNKLVARVTRYQEAVERKNQRRKKKRLGKRLAAAERIADPVAKAKTFDKIWRSVTSPVPKFDRGPEATEARQAKLVDAIFKGSTLASAWRNAGFSARHHCSLFTLLKSPFIRAEVVRHLNAGGKLRGKLHQAVMDKLGWHPARLEDLI